MDCIRRTLIVFCALFVSVLLQTANADVGKWVTHGPFGGCCGEFLFHPTVKNLVFGVGEDLFRSYDGGIHWKRLNLRNVLNQEYLNITTARLDPSNPDRIVVFAEALQLLISNDQGNNWQVVQPNFNPYPRELSLIEFEIDPHNSHRMYAVFNFGPGYKSTDGGATWQYISDASAPEISQIELHPKASNILYALSYNNRPIVIKSTDAGKTWQSSSRGLPNNFSGDLVLDRSNPNVLYIAGTAKTIDGGKNWIRTPCNCTVNGMALDPQNKNILYLAASEGLLKSTNGGSSWRSMPLPNVFGSSPNSVSVNSMDSSVLLAGTLVGLMRSSNAGSFWKFVATGPGGAQAFHLAIGHSRPGLIFASAPLVLYRSTSGGNEWETVSRFPAEFGVWNSAVHPANSNLIAAIGYLRNNQSRIALSTDAGKTWIFRTLNVVNPYSIEFDPIDTTTIYVGARGSYAMTKSTDFGKTWHFINKGLNGIDLVSVIAIDSKNTNRVFIGTNANKIFGSDDGGAHWKEQNQGIPAPTEDNFFINSLRFDPSHSNVLYTANSADVFKSTDGGKSWIKKDRGLPSQRYVNFVLIDPANPSKLYTGGEMTPPIFVSEDGGENWSAFSTKGLPQVTILSLGISAAQEDKLYALTNKGIFSYILPD